MSQGGNYDYDEDDKKDQDASGQFKEFDCPDCSANNPVDPPFADGDEVRCNYCGTEYKVIVTEAGRLKFREV